MTLKDRILMMEHIYVTMFSQVYENDTAIKYIDSILPTMYSHNFVYYKSKEGLYDYIMSEINKEETRSKGFFRIKTVGLLESVVIKQFPIVPEVTYYSLVHRETKDYETINGNPDCQVVKATDEKTLEDGAKVDLLANEQVLGDFAKKRIERKLQVYKNKDKALNMYVCYHQGLPIGNIEYIAANGIVKFEDFDILEDYQRKGFGSSVLKHLLKEANNEGIRDAYLVTDNSGTAIEMYHKCGFRKIFEVTELTFFFS